MAFIQGGYHTVKWIVPQSNYIMMEFGLRRFDLCGDVVWPLLCFLIGFALCIAGAVQSVKVWRQQNIAGEIQNSRKYALIYIVLGIFFTLALVWYLGWLEPHWESVTTRMIPDGSETTFFRDPVWIRELLSWKVINFLLGIVVTGLGIVQLMKAK